VIPNHTSVTMALVRQRQDEVRRQFRTIRNRKPQR
jgi:hypothetical protein